MSSANGARSPFDLWNKSKVDLDCFLVGLFRMAGGLIRLGGGKLGLRFPAARPLLSIVMTPNTMGALVAVAAVSPAPPYSVFRKCPAEGSLARRHHPQACRALGHGEGERDNAH